MWLLYPPSTLVRQSNQPREPTAHSHLPPTYCPLILRIKMPMALTPLVPGSYQRDDGRVEVAKFDWSEDTEITNADAVRILTPK